MNERNVTALMDLLTKDDLGHRLHLRIVGAHEDDPSPALMVARFLAARGVVAAFDLSDAQCRDVFDYLRRDDATSLDVRYRLAGIADGTVSI